MNESSGATLGGRQYQSATPEKAATSKERVRLLAREEFSRKSVSYVVGGFLVALLGLATVVGFSSAVIPLSEDARSEGFVTDLIFLFITSTLSVNFLSPSYFFIHRDPFRGWILFQRSLPIPPRETILGRTLVMLPTTLVMTALFFTPLVAVALALDDRFGAGQYLWFALVWLGYALFCGGISLYLELGLTGKLVLALQGLWMVSIFAVVWLMDGTLVLKTFGLAGTYGPLAAGISLLVGGLLFALLAKATERRVGKREFSA